jgi:UDP-N-acetyl-D-glucosamine/UDP-N-acetyl-D-galactosamine dehydrogenase
MPITGAARSATPASPQTANPSIDVVAVVGLGYVGLPLALAFGRAARAIGFDLSREKIASYRKGVDPSGEVDAVAFREARHLEYADDAVALAAADAIVVSVPTPVDEARQPDFGPLISACRGIGPHLKHGAVVIFESTVYPGATEEICVPELERASGKKWKRDFFVGYSPERINPGDKEHSLERIVKVVSGDTPETLERVAALYGRVIEAGVHRASGIRVAEAAKVIENTQRDLNIALMNELAIIFHRMGIDTKEVLDAAGTKWNFLKFKPGLVGGHCIGVDPYYLTHQAEKWGHHPQVILAGRRINDGMGKYIAEQVVKCLVASGRPVNGAKIAVLGLTFKENCADIRNSKVVDMLRELESYGAEVHVHDPRAEADAASHEYGINLTTLEHLPQVDALILAVAHREYLAMPLGSLVSRVVPGGCMVDVKSALDRDAVERMGLRFWRL